MALNPVDGEYPGKVPHDAVRDHRIVDRLKPSSGVYTRVENQCVADPQV